MQGICWCLAMAYNVCKKNPTTCAHLLHQTERGSLLAKLEGDEINRECDPFTTGHAFGFFFIVVIKLIPNTGS